MERRETRRTWPRIILTIPPKAADALTALAQEHYRDRKQEALRLLLDGIEREGRIESEGRR